MIKSCHHSDESASLQLTMLNLYSTFKKTVRLRKYYRPSEKLVDLSLSKVALHRVHEPSLRSVCIKIFTNLGFECRSMSITGAWPTWVIATTPSRPSPPLSVGPGRRTGGQPPQAGGGGHPRLRARWVDIFSCSLQDSRCGCFIF